MEKENCRFISEWIKYYKFYNNTYYSYAGDDIIIN